MAKKIVRIGVETCSYGGCVERFSEMLLGVGYTPAQAVPIVFPDDAAHPEHCEKWLRELAGAMSDLQGEQ